MNKIDHEEFIIRQLKVARIKARSYCRARCIPVDDEILELAGIGLFEALRTYEKDKGAWDWWLFVCIRREIVDHLRSWWLGPRKGKKGYVGCNWESLEQETNFQDAGMLPYIKEKDTLIYDERLEERVIAKDLIRKILKRLRPNKLLEDRRFKMRVIEEMKHKDIAKKEGVSIETVQSEVSRVRTKIKKWGMVCQEEVISKRG